MLPVAARLGPNANVRQRNQTHRAPLLGGGTLRRLKAVPDDGSGPGVLMRSPCAPDRTRPLFKSAFSFKTGCEVLVYSGGYSGHWAVSCAFRHGRGSRESAPRRGRRRRGNGACSARRMECVHGIDSARPADADEAHRATHSDQCADVEGAELQGLHEATTAGENVDGHKRPRVFWLDWCRTQSVWNVVCGHAWWTAADYTTERHLPEVAWVSLADIGNGKAGGTINDREWHENMMFSNVYMKFQGFTPEEAALREESNMMEYIVEMGALHTIPLFFLLSGYISAMSVRRPDAKALSLDGVYPSLEELEKQSAQPLEDLGERGGLLSLAWRRGQRLILPFIFGTLCAVLPRELLVNAEKGQEFNPMRLAMSEMYFLYVLFALAVVNYPWCQFLHLFNQHFETACAMAVHAAAAAGADIVPASRADGEHVTHGLPGASPRYPAALLAAVQARLGVLRRRYCAYLLATVTLLFAAPVIASVLFEPTDFAIPWQWIYALPATAVCSNALQLSALALLSHAINSPANSAQDARARVLGAQALVALSVAVFVAGTFVLVAPALKVACAWDM